MGKCTPLGHGNQLTPACSGCLRSVRNPDDYLPALVLCKSRGKCIWLGKLNCLLNNCQPGHVSLQAGIRGLEVLLQVLFNSNSSSGPGKWNLSTNSTWWQPAVEAKDKLHAQNFFQEQLGSLGTTTSDPRLKRFLIIFTTLARNNTTNSERRRRLCLLWEIRWKIFSSALKVT